MTHKILFIGLFLFALTPFASPPVALALGLAFGLLFTHPFHAQSQKLSTTLLQVCVVGLGFGMNLQEVLRAGKSGFIRTLHQSAPNANDETIAPEILTRGSQLFAVNCASCHGASGAGDGVAGRALAPAPTNFHLKRPDAERSWRVLLEGVPGSAMPPWKNQLSDDDRRALVFYIRSLADSTQPAPTAVQLTMKGK